jgi:hypothetical protein
LITKEETNFISFEENSSTNEEWSVIAHETLQTSLVGTSMERVYYVE